MKRSELIFSALLVPVDYLMLVIAGAVAYQLRFGQFIQGIRPVFYDIDLKEYLTITAVVAGIFLVVFALNGLYAIHRSRGFLAEFGKIFVSCSAAITIMILVVFFQRESFSSRFIVLFGWLFSIFFVTVGRSCVRWIQRILIRRGVGMGKAVLIGADEYTENIAKEFHRNPSLGLEVVRRYPTFDESARQELTRPDTPIQYDEIVVGYGSLNNQDMLAIKQFADERHLGFRYVAGLFQFPSSHIVFTTIADIPVVEVLRTRLDGWGKIWKRTFDLIVATVLLLVLSPILLLVALIIKVDSAGPMIEPLKRIGEKGRPFYLYKFRSMVKNAHLLKKELLQYNERRDGPLFKIKDDPRITRVGKYLRKLSIDELPQLWNVVLGHMSLVGPRPHEPEEVSRYEDWQRRLLTIKPGMTGLAQISGRSDLKFQDEARLDLYYIENWSTGLDIRILLRTPWVVLGAKSVS